MNTRDIDTKLDGEGDVVVDIGDFRVRTRPSTERAPLRCPHIRVEYCTTDRTAYCLQCERFIDPFDAFVSLVRHHEKGQRYLERKAAEIKEIAAKTLTRRAAKALEALWRDRHREPACPSCNKPLKPEQLENPPTVYRDRRTQQWALHLQDDKE